MTVFILFQMVTFLINSYCQQTYDGTSVRTNGAVTLEQAKRWGDLGKKNLDPMTHRNQTSWSTTLGREEEEQPMGNFLKAVDENPNTKVVNKIYFLPILPLTEDQSKIIEKVAEFTSLFYGVQTVILPKRSPSGLKKNAKGQFDADDVTDKFLSTSVSDQNQREALAIVAITQTDLTAENLNFVFGSASERFPHVVWSFNRFSENKSLFERSLKITTHELGHNLFLPHTKTHRCIMNGYNNLADLDSSPLELCPADASKIYFYRSLDPEKRYRALINFAEKNRILPIEINIWKRQLADLEKMKSYSRPSSPQSRVN